MTALHSIVDINVALQRALGFGEVTQVRGMTVRIEAGELPIVTVERIVLPGQAGALMDGVSTVVAVYQLTPTPVEQT